MPEVWNPAACNGPYLMWIFNCHCTVDIFTSNDVTWVSKSYLCNCKGWGWGVGVGGCEKERAGKRSGGMGRDLGVGMDIQPETWKKTNIQQEKKKNPPWKLQTKQILASIKLLLLFRKNLYFNTLMENNNNNNKKNQREGETVEGGWGATNQVRLSCA